MHGMTESVYIKTNEHAMDIRYLCTTALKGK